MSRTVPTIEDYKFNAIVELTVINCGKCGGTYAINERHRAECCEHGKGWHCPYCQTGWGYFGKTEAERERALRRQAEARAQRMRDERDTAENRRRAERAAKTRIKNRVAKGVCPCCNRHFDNLQRHMQNQHPTFTTTD